MLLAVLPSASMLRPVEPSRMLSRCPSSVAGLCSGAGIPPAHSGRTQHRDQHRDQRWRFLQGDERTEQTPHVFSISRFFIIGFFFDLISID